MSFELMRFNCKHKGERKRSDEIESSTKGVHVRDSREWWLIALLVMHLHLFVIMYLFSYLLTKMSKQCTQKLQKYTVYEIDRKNKPHGFSF